MTVSIRALIRRINRRLAHKYEILRKTRSHRWWSDLGDYYVLDWNLNFVVASHVDPETLGRELGALKSWETVVVE